jgi:hypothetical protein
MVWSSATGRPSPAQHEPALGELTQRILEGREVPPGEGVDRAAAPSCGADPAAQHGRAGALLRLGEQVKQDGQLRAMVELAREQRQRIDAEDVAQLIIGETEEVQQACGAL